MWMPLHVPDASDGLHLWAAGPELVEVLELSFLQQVLAAAVAGELVPHPAEEWRKREERFSFKENTDVPTKIKAQMNKSFFKVELAVVPPTPVYQSFLCFAVSLKEVY